MVSWDSFRVYSGQKAKIYRKLLKMPKKWGYRGQDDIVIGLKIVQIFG